LFIDVEDSEWERLDRGIGALGGNRYIDKCDEVDVALFIL
jgi:hypothetical protein